MKKSMARISSNANRVISEESGLFLYLKEMGIIKSLG